MIYKQIKNNSIIMIEMSSTNKNDNLNLCKNDKTCELSTLSNIITLSKECIKFLDLLQDKRRKILLDIQNNENDFFEDLIDVKYDRSQRIVYCQLCELTKR
jgi:hypothetical protein